MIKVEVYCGKTEILLDQVSDEIKTKIKDLAWEAARILSVISEEWDKYDNEMHKKIVAKSKWFGFSHGFDNKQSIAIFRDIIYNNPVQLCIVQPYKQFNSEMVEEMKIALKKSCWHK